MAYEPLHHKYRPQTFAELVGQEAIASTLTNALQQQRIAPAYLFTGPRGTGKTSSARILAKSLNCLSSDRPTPTPCGTCNACREIARGGALDVIEIDAASNTGVDNIRELIERAQFAPVQCRFKVYVIDECHMLSVAAFNALLKTLEEPPERVVFVLATTDPQRVLATIISRCQRFDFRRIPLESMTQHLQAIAHQETIQIQPDAVQLVAQISQGGLRDAESLLDQLSLLDGEIEVETVWDLVGAVPERNLFALIEAIAHNDGIGVLDQARQLMDRGREPLILLQNLASFYRDLLIAKTAPDRADLVALTAPTWEKLCQFAQTQIDLGTILVSQQHLRSAEVQVKNSTQPRLWLEVTLLGLLPAAIAGITGQPSVASGQLPAVSGQPSAVSGQPSAVSGQLPVGARLPRPSSGQPSVASGQPSAVSGQSPVASGQPSVASGQLPVGARLPRPSSGQSPVASGQPSVASGQPSVASGQPSPAHPSPAHPSPTHPSSAHPSSAHPSPAQDRSTTDLAETWAQVLAQMHPLSKGLLKDHGRLIDLTETKAEIAISSQTLMNIAQGRKDSVEAAFKAVLGRSLRIGFSVSKDKPAADPASSSDPSGGSTNGASSGSSGAIATPSPVPPPAPIRPASNPTPNSSPKPAADPPAATYGSPSADSSAVPTHASEGSPRAKESVTPSADPAVTWQPDDEVTQAAKRFAQMFNGQIVQVDDAFDLDKAIDQIQSHQPSSQSVSEDPAGDVPF